MMRFCLPAVAFLTLIGCNKVDNLTGDSTGNPETGKKAPLVFDESSILRPPAIGKSENAPSAKTASTYYTFWAPSQIDWSDCSYQMAGTAGTYSCGTTSGYQTGHVEATYSSRVAANPSQIWQPVSGMKAIQNMVLLDNEQAESHLFPARVPRYSRTWPYNQIGWYPIRVDLDYEVSSESGWDYLWINSTASDNSCNSPGVVRAKVSGVQSGHVSFTIPGECENPWVGVYYIKDGSLSHNGDYGRVKNVSMWPEIPVGG